MIRIRRPASSGAPLLEGALLCALVLSGCAPPAAEISPFAPLESARIAPPPGAPEGSCWAQDTTPAVVETVTAQVMTDPAQLNPDGSLRSPARFSTETRQEIVTPRRTFQFETLCAADITPQFVASLQRALQARGYYDAAITGTFDQPTDAALRAYQSAQGVQTGFLTLQTARDFGLAPAVF